MNGEQLRPGTGPLTSAKPVLGGRAPVGETIMRGRSALVFMLEFDLHICECLRFTNVGGSKKRKSMRKRKRKKTDKQIEPDALVKIAMHCS